MRYELMEWFRYEPTTGKLYWKKSNSNRVKVGDEAGCILANGYRQVGLNGTNYYVHRIIWTMYRGRPDPNLEILHDDGDGLNNKLSNLSLDTHGENGKNLIMKSNNTSGVTGVYWIKARRKWYAEIVVDRKKIFLGGFTHKQDAITARKEAEEKYGFHKDHGRKINV